MTKRAILAIDQGTTGTTALLLDTEGKTLGKHGVEFPQHFPKPGWVEHDAEQIWESVAAAVKGALAHAGIDAAAIAAIGITNQRETTVVWEKKSGKPVHRAVVWQCRRTADVIEKLRAEGLTETVQQHTGLVLDAYFSGTKIAWVLDHVEGARARADRGELAFGTIDSFLVHRLSGGTKHVTDYTNASRTLLLHLSKLEWDPEMLRLFRVPESMLPTLVGNAETIAETRGLSFLPDGIPICGMAGDQQAALFGQGCLEEGDAKCTYGTGAFALVNLGTTPRLSTHGLVTTVAWKLADRPVYALEGSAFVAGAVVQWLRDGLGIIQSATEIEALAASVESSEGVVLVPALAGLGAPYWDQDARGLIAGITRGTTKAHLARAALEGIAFEVNDLLEAGEARLARLRVDGGAAANDLLMQFQADISQTTVERPVELESTGRGAALLAGLGAGLMDLGKVHSLGTVERSFEPKMPDVARTKALRSWREAVGRARSHAR